METLNEPENWSMGFFPFKDTAPEYIAKHGLNPYGSAMFIINRPAGLESESTLIRYIEKTFNMSFKQVTLTGLIFEQQKGDKDSIKDKENENIQTESQEEAAAVQDPGQG